MINTRLYNLSEEYKFLLSDLYNEETGVVDETALERLNEVKDSIDNKCINITRLLKDIKSERESIKKEIDSMSKRMKSLDKQLSSLNDYMLTNMEKCEITEIKCPQFVIKLAKNPESIEILDEDSIPDEYKKYKLEYDKLKIKSDIKKGISVPGAYMSNKNRIEIR